MKEIWNLFVRGGHIFFFMNNYISIFYLQFTVSKISIDHASLLLLREKKKCIRVK
jgi:hypothetical protein